MRASLALLILLAAVAAAKNEPQDPSQAASQKPRRPQKHVVMFGYPTATSHHMILAKIGRELKTRDYKVHCRL